jgi:hypothetical protein
MKIKEQLMMELSRRNTDVITQYIGDDTEKFRQLMDLLFHGEPPLPQRAAWVVSTIADKNPELCLPYLEPIVLHLEKFKHTGIHRCLLRFIAEISVPESLQGYLFDICYQWLILRDTPIAVKVYSMQILFNISETEPDLKQELRLLFEELTEHESPGIKSRSRYLIEKLTK